MMQYNRSIVHSNNTRSNINNAHGVMRGSGIADGILCLEYWLHSRAYDGILLIVCSVASAVVVMIVMMYIIQKWLQWFI